MTRRSMHLNHDFDVGCGVDGVANFVAEIPVNCVLHVSSPYDVPSQIPLIATRPPQDDMIFFALVNTNRHPTLRALY